MRTKKVKGKRSSTVPLLAYLMVPLAALMSPLKQALFGDERVYLQQLMTTPSLLKWMDARILDVKEYTALGLPPTSLLKALRGMVALEAEFGQIKMTGSDNITVPIVREPHHQPGTATLKEVLEEEAATLSQQMDRKSDWFGSPYQGVMDMAHHEVMAQAVLAMETVDTLVALDVYGETGEEQKLMRIGAMIYNDTRVGLAVDGQITVGHMGLEEAQAMKTQSAYTSSVMEHGSAAA